MRAVSVHVLEVRGRLAQFGVTISPSTNYIQLSPKTHYNIEVILFSLDATPGQG